jgi:hypothetical protein
MALEDPDLIPLYDSPRWPLFQDSLLRLLIRSGHRKIKDLDYAKVLLRLKAFIATLLYITPCLVLLHMLIKEP